MSDESRKGKPRVVEPQRRQGVIRFEMPEDKLAPTHTARVLWDVIGALDLTAFLDGVKATEGTVGRKTLSPQMKLTLWLYAISNGIGSAREASKTLCPTRLEWARSGWSPGGAARPDDRGDRQSIMAAMAAARGLAM